jgi:hypothetical protein
MVLIERTHICIHLNAEMKIFIDSTVVDDDDDDDVVINIWSDISDFKSKLAFIKYLYLNLPYKNDTELWECKGNICINYLHFFSFRIIFGVIIFRLPILVQVYCSA